MDTKKFKEIENKASSGSIPNTAYEAYGLYD